MATEHNPTVKGPETIPPPRCPHCATELTGIGCYAWTQGPFTILAVCCTNLECRALFHCEIVQGVPVAPDGAAGPPPPPSGPRLWQPRH